MTTIVTALKRTSIIVPLLAVVLTVSVAPSGMMSSDRPIYDRFDEVPGTVDEGFWQVGVPVEPLAEQAV